MRFDAPRFFSVDLTPLDFSCPSWPVDFSWAPDGQSVVFAGPLPATHEYTDDSDYSEPWLISRDGANPHPIAPGETAAWWLTFIGWQDQHTLVYRGYAGGGHRYTESINILTGESIAWAIVQGSVSEQNAEYVALNCFCAGNRVWVMSNDYDPEGEEFVSGPYARPIPQETLYEYDYFVNTQFEDWFPAKNLMLVSKTIYANGPERMPITQLITWDLPKDSVSTLIPDGYKGQISPDGQQIAYLTFGPPHLDKNHRPTGPDLSVEYLNAPHYLQLYDLTSNRVISSFPVARDLVDRHFAFFNTHFFFSPDSTYLAAIVPADDAGNIKPVTAYLPAIVPADDAGNAKNDHRLRVVNAVSGTIKLELASDFDTITWSPDSQRLVFRKADGNLAVLNTENGDVNTLTTANGHLAKNPQWSFDGTYLSIHYQSGLYGENSVVIVPVP